MSRDIDESSENVLYDWSGREQPAEEAADEADGAGGGPSWGTATASESGPISEEDVGAHPVVDPDTQSPPDEHDLQDQPPADPIAASSLLVEEEEKGPTVIEDVPEPLEDDSADGPEQVSSEHAAGDLDIPDGYTVLEGVADGTRRAVAVVAARFNGDVTSRLLRSALDELEAAGVRQDAVTVLVVPGAFELPLAATALAKTRRYACVVALGCVIRGDTPHFDYVAGEAASGLQLAALETGVPVSFGVLTLDRVEQADARIEKGAEAVRTALEMADVFSHLRAAAGG
jgi:6,7-dimethyl-8-ribityllumazine synthase